MLGLKRAAVVTGMTGALVLAWTVPAFAGGPWGSTDCSQTPSPACDLGAGQGGDDGGPVHPGPRPKPGHGSGGGDDQGLGEQSQPPGDQLIGPSDKTANCSYQRSDYQPPAGGVATASYSPPHGSGGAPVVEPALFRPSGSGARVMLASYVRPAAAQPGQGPGAWYIYKCNGQGFADALYRPPVWIPDAPGGPTPLPSPAELAQRARNQLRLPGPTIATNPRGDQLVNLPTWLWLSSGWAPQSATASVPGVSVTAVATPTRTDWAMGDGRNVTCQGSGTPFPSGGDPKAASPDCGYTYRTSSAGQPNNAYPVSATVHWTITWSGAGQSGTFPDMTTTSNASVRVAESQALNTGG